MTSPRTSPTTSDATSTAPPGFHMSSEEFRRHGHAMVDWIADYHERVEQLPVLSTLEPGAVRAGLPDAPPVRGVPFEQMMADLDPLIVPGLTHWQSPNWFAFFPANISGPSILGELLSAGLGVQGMLWVTSPACTELETHVLDWLVEMLDLPSSFKSSGAGGGVIQDTASSATLCALLAARERLTGFTTNTTGVREQFVAYTSREAHSSLQKSMMIAGLGTDNLRLVEVDDRLAMRPDRLESLIEADLQAGRRPCFVCATVGTTSTNAMDPIRPIGEICRRHGLWLHVDAAMSGTAALCPELRGMHEGLEHADSYCFNPHKWMFTNFDCDCFYVTDRAALIRTLSVLPEYLKNAATESGAVIDYRDWHIPLGRRFRALKLWFVIRHYGIEGLQHHVREHVVLAQAFAEMVRADDRWVLAVDPPLNLVCFRHVDGDGATEAIMEDVNRSGGMYITSTRVDDRLVLRMAIGQARTERRHVEAAWLRLCAAADRARP